MIYVIAFIIVVTGLYFAKKGATPERRMQIDAGESVVSIVIGVVFMTAPERVLQLILSIMADIEGKSVAGMAQDLELFRPDQMQGWLTGIFWLGALIAGVSTAKIVIQFMKIAQGAAEKS